MGERDPRVLQRDDLLGLSRHRRDPDDRVNIRTGEQHPDLALVRVQRRDRLRAADGHRRRRRQQRRGGPELPQPRRAGPRTTSPRRPTRPLPRMTRTGYTWDVDSTQHVVYRGADSHIHELWFNGGWHHNDLTALPARRPRPGDPAGYTWDVDSTQHVVYRGTDNHIHELWFNGGWHHNDLTNAAGAPLGRGRPAGYIWDVDQHPTRRLPRHRQPRPRTVVQRRLAPQRSHDAAGRRSARRRDPAGYTWDVDHTATRDLSRRRRPRPRAVVQRRLAPQRPLGRGQRAAPAGRSRRLHLERRQHPAQRLPGRSTATSTSCGSTASGTTTTSPARPVASPRRERPDRVHLGRRPAPNTSSTAAATAASTSCGSTAYGTTTTSPAPPATPDPPSGSRPGTPGARTTPST